MKVRFIITHKETGKQKLTFTNSWEEYSRLKQLLSEVPEAYSYTEKILDKPKRTRTHRQRAMKKYI